MENNKFDKKIRGSLKEMEMAPRHINQSLLENSRNKNEFKGLILIFFILSIIQSLFIILIGIFLISNIIMKIFIIEFGIILLLTSVFMYIGLKKERGGLICRV